MGVCQYGTTQSRTELGYQRLYVRLHDVARGWYARALDVHRAVENVVGRLYRNGVETGNEFCTEVDMEKLVIHGRVYRVEQVCHLGVICKMSVSRGQQDSTKRTRRSRNKAGIQEVVTRYQDTKLWIHLYRRLENRITEIEQTHSCRQTYSFERCCSAVYGSTETFFCPALLGRLGLIKK